MLLHAADFTGTTKPFHIASAWSENVNKEFSKQVSIKFFIFITQNKIFYNFYLF